jgi:hypothetical protein
VPIEPIGYTSGKAQHCPNELHWFIWYALLSNTGWPALASASYDNTVRLWVSKTGDATQALHVKQWHFMSFYREDLCMIRR